MLVNKVSSKSKWFNKDKFNHKININSNKSLSKINRDKDRIKIINNKSIQVKFKFKTIINKEQCVRKILKILPQRNSKNLAFK